MPYWRSGRVLPAREPMERHPEKSKHNHRPPRIGDLPPADRPRERLRRQGERALSNIELLSIVLGSGYKGESALQMAQLLLAELSGLPGLGRSTVAELQAYRGIGPAKAAQILAALELGRRLLTTPPEDRPQVVSPHDAARLLMPAMAPEGPEQLRLILLDARSRVLATPVVHSGPPEPEAVDATTMLRIAIKANAAAFIVAHNPRSGDPSPSPEYVALTQQLIAAGSLFDIELLDGIVIAGERYTSLKDRGLAFG